MKSGLAFGLGFFFGGGCATAVACLILKQKYAQKADEEIASCREAFVQESVKFKKEQAAKSKEEKKTVAAEAMRTYSAEPDKAERMVKTEASEPDKSKDWKAPYVIDPAIFDHKAPDDAYRSIGLKYYPADGVVTEDNDRLVTLDELDRMVGRQSLTHFGTGEFGEDDRVVVRNDNWHVDYEICIQPKSYKDILKEKPWLKK